VLTDWKPPVGSKKNENGSTRYEPQGEVSLIHEMMKMPDCNPAYLHGGGTVMPQVLPVYGMSGEIELADLFYAFIRLLRPPLVVECGCHLGFTTWALGKAAQTYDGDVISCDISPTYVETSRLRCAGLPVHISHCSVLDETFIAYAVSQADFIFIDSDENTRIPTLRNVKPGAIAVIHDTKNEPELMGGLAITQTEQRIDFTETHRGFTLLRKT